MRRREFLRATTLAGAGALLGLRPESGAAEPPPETPRLRLVKAGSICQAPQYLAEELFRSEGFTDVKYIPKEGPYAIAQALTSGEADINMHFSGPLIIRIDAGAPVVILAGVHPGCYELFGTGEMQAVNGSRHTVAVSCSPHVPDAGG